MKKIAIIACLAIWMLSGPTPLAAQNDSLNSYATFRICFNPWNPSDHPYADDFHITFIDSVRVVATNNKVAGGKWGSYTDSLKKTHHFPPRGSFGPSGRVPAGDCIEIQFRGKTLPEILDFTWTQGGRPLPKDSSDWTLASVPHSGETAVISTGNHTWSSIPLTGPLAKIRLAGKAPRISIGLDGMLPLGDPTAQQVDFNRLQAAVFEPAVMEQLFEKLGGEFFIGDLSGPRTEAVELIGSAKAIPGFQIGLRLGQGFELRTAARYFRNQWSGSFPVIVFPPGSNAPKTLQGSIEAKVSGLLASADLAYYFAKGTFQPFLAGGVRGQFPVQTNSGAEIEGLSIPLEIEPVSTVFSPFASAGLRIGLWKNGFAELGCTYGKIPGTGFVPTPGAGIGCRF